MPWAVTAILVFFSLLAMVFIARSNADANAKAAIIQREINDLNQQKLLLSKDIEAVTFDPTYHTPVSDYVFNANAGTISDLEQGPDGNLYFTSIFDSKVQKITATGPFAPTAAAQSTTTLVPTLTRS